MIVPLRRLIYVIPIEDPIKQGSIIVPNAYRQRVDHGIIKYRGPDVKELRVGDHVIFNGYIGTRAAIADEGILYIMEESDVDAIWKRGETPHLFTQETISRFITRACFETALHLDGNTKLTREIEDRMQAYLNDFFVNEGIMF